MISFPSIESLRSVVHSIDTYCELNGTPKPTIKFRGTVKLHGSNGGVNVNPARVQAQSRNNELTAGVDDNMGFAHFVSSRTDEFRRLAADLVPGCPDVTLFGEWCGVGIMKGMGISKLPKMFVIFGVLDATTETWVPFDSSTLVGVDRIWLNNQNIYFIDQAETFEVEINFNHPGDVSEVLAELTLRVEHQCPFANSKMFTAYHRGEDAGLGEGIVWTSYDYPKVFQFKTKGLKHKKAGVKIHIPISAEKLEGIHNVVDEILPPWRLEQGLDALREANVTFDNKAIGPYIKWVCQDVLKEEGATVEANEFTWKEVQGEVTLRARTFFTSQLDALAGLA